MDFYGSFLENAIWKSNVDTVKTYRTCQIKHMQCTKKRRVGTRDQLKFKRDNNRENWGQKEGLSNSLMSSQTLLYRWDELVKIHIRSALKAGHKHLEAVPRLLNHFPVSPEFLWRCRTQSRRGSAPNPRRDSPRGPPLSRAGCGRTGLEAPGLLGARRSLRVQLEFVFFETD